MNWLMRWGLRRERVDGRLRGGAVTHRFPWLLPNFAEHLSDQEGEILPHLYMADVERWAEAEVRRVSSGSGELAELLGLLEKGFLGSVETAARRGGFLETALTALGPLGLQVDSCRTRSWQYCTARFVTTQLIEAVVSAGVGALVSKIDDLTGVLDKLSPRNTTKTTEAARGLSGVNRGGSALKTDAQHAFPDFVDNFATEGSKFSIPTKGPGGVVVRNSELFQFEGSLNGKSGVFEWIVD